MQITGSTQKYSRNREQFNCRLALITGQPRNILEVIVNLFEANAAFKFCFSTCLTFDFKGYLVFEMSFKVFI